MTNTNRTLEAARAAGLSEGHSDATGWIDDERARLRTEDPGCADNLSEILHAAMRPGVAGADEGLINAVGDKELAELVGFEVRDSDGYWTPEAEAFLKAYNEGWREAVESALAS